MEFDSIGKDFIEVLSYARSKRLSPSEGYQISHRPGTEAHFLSFVESYNDWKFKFGYIDFTDMLDIAAKTLKRAQVNYGLVIVDEAQDMTPLHWAVIERILEVNPECQVIASGDDDQCLYTFAGAQADGMPQFEARYNAERTILEQSFRVPQTVFELAQTVVHQIEQRVQKKYFPRKAIGSVTYFPSTQFMEITPKVDTLVLYADKFVRADMVEPMLKDSLIRYRSLNGFPAPLDTKAGRLIMMIQQYSNDQILDDEDLTGQVRSCLSRQGLEVWNHVAPSAILNRIRHWDWSLIAGYARSNQYYLERITDISPTVVRISTMHGAKGLQADDVHLVLSLSERATLEAAINPDHVHRLIYTAITRTKERLFIYEDRNSYMLPAVSRG